MYTIEKVTDYLIQHIYRKNIIEGENECSYWERHWEEHMSYFKKYKIPSEIKDLWMKNLYNEMLTFYSGILGQLDGKHICELGCGSGYPTLLMSQKGAKVTLVDFSENACRYAKQICTYLKIDPKSIDFKIEDAFSKTLDIGKFDVVWNCGVIEHYEWDAAVNLIRVMSKHAKKGGKVMVTLPNLCAPEMIYALTAVGKGSEIFYSHRMLKRIMEEAGLKNVRVDPINYWVPSCFHPKYADQMRKHRLLKPFKGLAWLFNAVGTK